MLKTNESGKLLVENIARKVSVKILVTENKMKEGNYFIQFLDGEKKEAKLIRLLRNLTVKSLTTEIIIQGTTTIINKS